VDGKSFHVCHLEIQKGGVAQHRLDLEGMVSSPLVGALVVDVA
jgi:hypothetical protein